MIGNLEPSGPSFAGDLERLHSSRLFLGIRYGNLWDRNPDRTGGRQCGDE